MLRLFLIITIICTTYINASLRRCSTVLSGNISSGINVGPVPPFPSARTMEVLCEQVLRPKLLPPACEAINVTLEHRQQFKPHSVLPGAAFLHQYLMRNAPHAIWQQASALRRYLNWYALNQMQTPDCNLQNGFSRVEHIDGITVSCFARGGWEISKNDASCPWDVHEFPNVFFVAGQFKNPDDVAVHYDWINSIDGVIPRFVTFNMQGTLQRDSVILTRKGSGAIALHISGSNHVNPYTILNTWEMLETSPLLCGSKEKEIAEMFKRMPTTKMTTVTPLSDQQSTFFKEN